MSDMSPAWRRLTEAELEALAPFTIRCAGMAPEAVEAVRREFFKMLGRAVGRFHHHLHRPPDEREAKLLCRAIVQFVNASVVPLHGGRGRASLH